MKNSRKWRGINSSSQTLCLTNLKLLNLMSRVTELRRRPSVWQIKISRALKSSLSKWKNTDFCTLIMSRSVQSCKKSFRKLRAWSPNWGRKRWFRYCQWSRTTCSDRATSWGSLSISLRSLPTSLWISLSRARSSTFKLKSPNRDFNPNNLEY